MNESKVLYGVANKEIFLWTANHSAQPVHRARTERGIAFYEPGFDICKQKHSTIILMEAEIYLD